MGGDHFVNVPVRVEAHWIIGHGDGVGVTRARGDAKVAQRNTATGIRVDGNGYAGGCAAGPQSHALIEFDIKPVGGVERGGIVVNNVQIDDVKRGSRGGVW